MAETATHKLPYPTLDDVAVAADDIARLALAVDGKLPGGPASLVWPVVTTLPTTPADGTMVILADAARNYVWLCRYDATMTGAYKWLVVAATPIVGRIVTQVSIMSTAYQAMTGGPSITIPRRGVYELEVGAELSYTARMTPSGLGVSAGDDASAGIGAVTADFQSCKGESVQTLTTTGTLQAYYRTTVTSGGWAKRRWIKATPLWIS